PASTTMLRMNRISRALTGGRPSHRAVAALLLTLLQTGFASADQSQPVVTVAVERGVYAVRAQFSVDQPSAIAWSVLTDYEQIPRFMPGVRKSLVHERTAGHAVLEQEAVSSVMMFSKRVHLVLEIEERSGALVFRDRCGLSFVSYEGAWRLAETDGRTETTYELSAEPSFDVPGFLLKRLLRRDSTQMIESLRREIEARAAASRLPPLTRP